MIPTLLGALTITFIVMQFVPGGPVEQLHGRGARRRRAAKPAATRPAATSTRSRCEELKKLYGFDKPAHVRYLEMLGNFARFDLGRSFLQNKDVWAADQGKAAGVDFARPVDLPHQLPDQHPARRREGGARRAAASTS